MSLLILVVAVPVCALLRWVCWLRFVRHVHDTSGADAIRHLPAVAHAYQARCNPDHTDG